MPPGRLGYRARVARTPSSCSPGTSATCPEMSAFQMFLPLATSWASHATCSSLPPETTGVSPGYGMMRRCECAAVSVIVDAKKCVPPRSTTTREVRAARSHAAWIERSGAASEPAAPSSPDGATKTAPAGSWVDCVARRAGADGAASGVGHDGSLRSSAKYRSLKSPLRGSSFCP